MNQNQVEVPEGFPKAFPFRGMHFFASIEKAKRDVPEWTPKFSMLEGLKSSYQQDYLARGFDKQQPDFRTDELILSKTMSAAWSSPGRKPFSFKLISTLRPWPTQANDR